MKRTHIIKTPNHHFHRFIIFKGRRDVIVTWHEHKSPYLIEAYVFAMFLAYPQAKIINVSEVEDITDCLEWERNHKGQILHHNWFHPSNPGDWREP